MWSKSWYWAKVTVFHYLMLKYQFFVWNSSKIVIFYFLIDEKLLKAVWIGDSKIYYFLFERFKPVFWKKRLKIEKMSKYIFCTQKNKWPALSENFKNFANFDIYGVHRCQ